jgi:hypothetical protein
MKTFRKSFDDAYFACDMLQLGFLKLLYGTNLREKADEYGFIASKKAPYTVLQTNWMSYEDMTLLTEIADVLDRYREGGGFESSLEYALSGIDSPFDFYFGLTNFIAECDGRSIRKISQNDAYALLYQYISLYYPQKEEEFELDSSIDVNPVEEQIVEEQSVDQSAVEQHEVQQENEKEQVEEVAQVPEIPEQKETVESPQKAPAKRGRKPKAKAVEETQPTEETGEKDSTETDRITEITNEIVEEMIDDGTIAVKEEPETKKTQTKKK